MTESFFTVAAHILLPHNHQFPIIIDDHWRKSMKDYREALMPDELSSNRLIRDGDLMHTPLMAKADRSGVEWRPVPAQMVGQRVGARRIRRPNSK